MSGEALRRARHDRSWTQAEAGAALTGVSTGAQSLAFAGQPR
jgi:hypothetical protein